MSSAIESGSSGDASSSELIGALEQGRRQFLQLVDHVRPELHRYCARMTGSVADGEDVVQDTLARAYHELSHMQSLPDLRPWLFRIAHNRAIDHWRHERRRASEPIEDALEVAAEAAFEPDNVMARGQAVRAALTGFLALAPAQPGRAALREVSEAPRSAPARRDVSSALVRYADLFNAHDWDDVRALLAEGVRLDLVSQRKAAGRREVGQYVDNYERASDWRLVAVWLDGREALAVVGTASDTTPRYFIDLRWNDAAQVATIRDFRYVRYIAIDASIDATASDQGHP